MAFSGSRYPGDEQTLDAISAGLSVYRPGWSGYGRLPSVRDALPNNSAWSNADARSVTRDGRQRQRWAGRCGRQLDAANGCLLRHPEQLQPRSLPGNAHVVTGQCTKLEEPDATLKPNSQHGMSRVRFDTVKAATDDYRLTTQ